MTSLPAWVGSALQDRLDHVSRLDLRDRARVLSETYRADGSSAVIRSDLDALTYALVRMPATYAAVRRARDRAATALSDFAPRSVLDVGCGPGTASLACRDVWPEARRLTLLDRNDWLLSLASALLAAGEPAADAHVVRGTAPAALSGLPAAEVVVASYALTEIDTSAIDAVLADLWRLAERLLVVVEPGTPRGFARILKYRDALLSRGAEIVAPCSHEGACPLASNPRWCHFSERLPRSRDHLVVKSGSVPFEDEAYCYLVAGKRLPRIARGRRVLATPRVTKASVTLTLCEPNAPAEQSIRRDDKAAFKAARRCDWGDLTDL